MTATVLAFRTEMELPPTNAVGNPDHVTILADFPTEDDATAWTEFVANEVEKSQGAFTAQAVRRLSSRPAGQSMLGDEGVATVFLRSVAALRRPSGRVAGVALIHVAINAEHSCMPEGGFVELRISTPVVHVAGLADATEVVEAALLHMLDQMEAAAMLVANSVKGAHNEPVVWSLPHRSGGTELLKELNSRLVCRFHDIYQAIAPVALAA